MRYDTATGSTLDLGREITRGGEGAIHEIKGDPSRVAKIYLAPMSVERAAKLGAIASVRTPRIEAVCAWPLDVLRDPRGAPVGFIMPAVRNAKDIHSLYGPRSRLREFPAADYRFLVATAANLARAFAIVHEHGHVIGDVNDRLAMVALDATVRLIDCDSFQVSVGRVYGCDVGVPTYQPPEMQARSSFRDVIRTANNDNFGLAVLLFQLLFLARHPFSGRPLDIDNLPIDRAIREHRFAYGSRSRQFRIEAPPNALGLSAVGQEIGLLFERAFAPESVNTDRPRAREWADGLQRLASSLACCQRNPNHWHLQGTASCPLCAIEAATGAVLFLRPNARSASASDITIDIAHLWAAIEAVPPPGVPPAPPFPSVFPVQARSRSAGWVRNLRVVLAIVASIAALAALSVSGWLTTILGAIAWSVLPGEDAEATARRHELAMAKSTYDRLVAALKATGNGAEHRSVRTQLETVRRQLQDLPAKRTAELARLEQDKRQLQLKAFLERFRIAKALILGIGPLRIATLESYGIETAADITEAAIMAVPGFGSVMACKLVSWRRQIEGSFVFDPSKPIDPARIAQLDADIARERTDLVQKLRDGPARLTAAKAGVERRRQELLVEIGAAARRLAQAQVELA